MTLQGLWQVLRHWHRRVNAFLKLFYHLGPSGHGAQGVVREFLDGPTEGVRLRWAHGQHGPVCEARDARGSYRIELARQDGFWEAHACSCLGFQEFRRECRHLRAARQALAVRDADGLCPEG